MNQPMPLIRIILLFLIPVLGINHAQAQINESISFSDLNAGDSIYVITNREIDTGSEKLSFNNEVNENAGLTYLKVTSNKLDEIESHLLSYNDFMAQVCNEKSDWLLFVHGDAKTYKQSVKRGFDIQQLHKINVIVFSWPSKDSDLNGIKNLKNSTTNVLKAKHHFNELIVFMDSLKKANKAFSENVKLSMLLHSLGNLYMENLVNESAIELEFNTLFDNVIINSAAVAQKKHKDWVEMINFQKRIYITNNKSDFNLKGKHLFFMHGNQLGEKAKNPIAKNANYVQFSKAIGFRFPTGTTHTFFIGTVPSESKNIHDFYFNVFHGNQIDFSNQSQFVKRRKRVGYDIIF